MLEKENETYEGIEKDYPFIYDNYYSLIDLLDNNWEIIRVGENRIKDVFEFISRI